MMWITTFFLIFSTLHAAPEIKKIIIEKQQALSLATSEAEKSQLLFELARAEVQDQEVDRAFGHFLEALRVLPKATASLSLSSEEEMLYQGAFEDYLRLSGKDPNLAAEELLKKYGKEAKEHPHFIKLNFLVSSAYANVGKYIEFFEKFYRGYPYLHDTFLAHKIEGILYLRLARRALSQEERRHQQHNAFCSLSRALEKNGKDPGLYKTLFFLETQEEKKEVQKLFYLEKIVQNQVVLPRGDIFFYVREAVELGAFDLGQALLDQAKEYYAYSRVVAEAQEYLNQHRG